MLYIPGPLPSLNEVLESAKGAGGSGRRYSALKRTWTETVWACAKSARLQRMPGAVRLRFLWRERNMKRDPDNIASAKKFVLDGLVVAGVIDGDGWKVVKEWEDLFTVADNDVGVVVTIMRVEE
jgi:hypothetical protein